MEEMCQRVLRCKRLAEICDCVLGCEGTEENVIVYSNVRGLKKCVVLRWEGKKCVLVCWNARGWKKMSSCGMGRIYYGVGTCRNGRNVSLCEEM